MADTTEPCAFPPCDRTAVRMVQVLVDGFPVVLLTCQPHLEWLLRSFAETDDAAGVCVREVINVSSDDDMPDVI